MKKFLVRFFYFFIALNSFIFSTEIFAAAETYTFDPMHTYVQWKINHFGFG